MDSFASKSISNNQDTYCITLNYIQRIIPTFRPKWKIGRWFKMLRGQIDQSLEKISSQIYFLRLHTARNYDFILGAAFPHTRVLETILGVHACTNGQISREKASPKANVIRLFGQIDRFAFPRQFQLQRNVMYQFFIDSTICLEVWKKVSCEMHNFPKSFENSIRNHSNTFNSIFPSVEKLERPHERFRNVQFGNADTCIFIPSDGIYWTKKRVKGQFISLRMEK